MNESEMNKLLSSAAAAALNRIRRDGNKARPETADVFSYLEKHIFSQNVDVNQLSRACGKHPNAVTALFRRTTQTTPHRYILERRMETAAALLIENDLKNWLIADLIGFSNESIFCRNFKKWTGHSPQIFQRRARLIFARARVKPSADTITMESLCRGVAYEPDSPAATEFLVQLRRAASTKKDYPLPDVIRGNEEESHIEKVPSLGEEIRDEIRNEAAWDTIQGKSLDVQRNIVRKFLFFSKPTFFHFLREKSLSAGRKDRKYGVHLAELALESLLVTERRSGQDLPSLICQGWAWVGNARRLAFDFHGSELAFATAEKFLGQVQGPSLIEAEFYILKASFRRWQRRSTDALELCKHALAIFRSVGNSKDLLRALLEAANIAEQAGKGTDCILFLNEAKDYLAESDNSHLRFTLYYNLASAYAKNENYQAATELLAMVRQLMPQQSQEMQPPVQWLEGFIKNGLGDTSQAELLFKGARTGFQRLGNIGCTSLIDLDLALLYLKQNRNTEVTHLAAGVIPIFQGLRIHEEANTAFELLQRAMAKRELTAEILTGVRNLLERIRLDPSIDFESLRIQGKDSA